MAAWKPESIPAATQGAAKVDCVTVCKREETISIQHNRQAEMDTNVVLCKAIQDIRAKPLRNMDMDSQVESNGISNLGLDTRYMLVFFLHNKSESLTRLGHR